jgi:cytochrome bd-type quinol oxidase subunit 2
MIKRIKYILAMGLVLGVGTLAFTGARIHAAAIDPKGQACEALGLASTGTNGECSGPNNINSVLKFAINLFSLVVGVAAVIMIIVGGLKYILSQGEGSNTASAKNTILYAIVGLVVVALAQIIVVFVLKKATAPPVAKCAAGQISTVAVPCAK